MSSRKIPRVGNDGRKYKNKKQRTSGSFGRKISKRMSISGLPSEHVFERTVLLSVPLWTNTGVGASLNASAGSGNNMAFEFSLAFILMNVGTGSVSASLNQAMANVTEFTNLFDQYKIVSTKLKLMFTNNNSSINSPSTALPEFIAMADHDDSIPLADSAYLQYQKLQIKQLGQPNDPLKRTVYPKPLVQTYRTAIAAGYSTPDKAIWIDVVNSDVPHYGLKIAFNQYANNTAVDTKLGKLDFYFTQRFLLKTVR